MLRNTGPVAIMLALQAACVDPAPRVGAHGAPVEVGGEPLLVDVVTAASTDGTLWIEIAAPEDGAVVAPGFTVYVAAGPSGNVIQSVELLVDGIVVAIDSTSPYTFITDGSLAGAARTIHARATDGNTVVEDGIRVTVTGTPPDRDPDPDRDPGSEPDPDSDPDADPDSDPGPAPDSDAEPWTPQLGGCAVAEGAGALAPPLLFALLALVVARRRRRVTPGSPGSRSCVRSRAEVGHRCPGRRRRAPARSGRRRSGRRRARRSTTGSGSRRG
jgi:hypothetical protein